MWSDDSNTAYESNLGPSCGREPEKRSGAWVKYRVNRGQEFVIGGYVPGNRLDSSIVGYYVGDKLMYAGKVKSGFVPRIRREVYETLKPMEIETCPFAILQRRNARSGD